MSILNWVQTFGQQIWASKPILEDIFQQMFVDPFVHLIYC